MAMKTAEEWVLWGSELSPFALKVAALCAFAGVRVRWLPAEGGFVDGVRHAVRRERVASRKLPLTWPQMTDLDEFPLVPFLFGPRGENLYDSSAIAEWFDRQGLRRRPDAPLVPDDDPLRFVVHLIDEALDEIGLYCVHHNRWVVSARDNDAGTRLAREWRPVMGPFSSRLGRRFAPRQVRRLPYLFSVAPEGAEFADLPEPLRPPTRAGFPPTHALLERIFAALLAAVEPVLRVRPFLFGPRFTLADASVYGQLEMNRKDPSADAWIRREAPAVSAWMDRIAAADFGAAEGEVRLDDALSPLLDWIADAFVPLMRQNHAAWRRHRDAGETLFNEPAFNRGRALYDGVLLGTPFRSVAKSFQVRVWLELEREWQAMPWSHRSRVASASKDLEAQLSDENQRA